MKKSVIFGAVAMSLAASLATSSAVAVTEIGNPGQKGSLLIYPRIEGGASETIVSMVNDYAAGVVRVKCFYAASDALPTPYTGTLAGVKSYKHYRDFEIELTHNQPIHWYARTGRSIDNRVQVAPGLNYQFPDGTTQNRVELKCWAVMPDGSDQRVHNHLFGTASILRPGLQAAEYTAYAFQVKGVQSDPVGNPGALLLNNVAYDACPAIIVGEYLATGAPTPFGAPNTELSLASCTQDLRQNYTPTITKFTWQFWNADEVPMTGAHQCVDSWYETNFPQSGAWNLNNGSYNILGTISAYFRIVPTADSSVCNNSTTPGYVGIKMESFDGGVFLRGTNLTGRAARNGSILYDVGVPDSFKQ